MKANGAMLWEPGTNSGWEIEELTLDPPKENEVMIRLTAAGLCHSDASADTGDLPYNGPVVGGHEGAGVIEEVGPGVERLEVGDHIVLSFVPACGHCRFCIMGISSMCDTTAGVLLGLAPDGTHRVHAQGKGLGCMSYLGTFCEYVVVPVDSCVKIDKAMPLDAATLISCGVPTGFGSAVNAAQAAVGDVAVVVGTGGVGMNAVQGFAYAGAEAVVAVDLHPYKRERAGEFGATHTAASIEEAEELVRDLTNGVMADKCVLTMGIVRGSDIQPALNLIRKAGTLVWTGVTAKDDNEITLNGLEFTMSAKRMQGAVLGHSNPHTDIPKLASLYMNGRLKLDELVTKRYKLEEINKGYEDMWEGSTIRGMIDYSL
jgi:NDMA-dependent alcohol dehydrogenase